MNILITGGTGFLGKALARRLMHDGNQVTVLGRNQTIGNKLVNEGMSFICADLADEEEIVSACEGQEYVFHCGALSSPWGPYESFYQTNVRGTENVIKGCEMHRVKRLIHVSTPSIYFYYNNRNDVKEDAELPKKFINHYATTKYIAEQRIMDAFTNGLPTIIIRPRALFGPEDNAIIPRLIEANQKIGVPIINGGNTLMDITYVENVVDALLLAKDAKHETLGKAYNITNGEPMLLNDLLASLFSMLQMEWNKRKMNYHIISFIARLLEAFHTIFIPNKEPVLTTYTVSVLTHSQTLNIDAAKQELGYEPRISIQEGMERFVKWWKEEENDNHI